MKTMTPTKSKKTLTATVTREIAIVDVDVSPLTSQVRRRARFELKSLEELADSIRRQGLINPITVRPIGKRFEIVAGERRFLAAKLADLPTITAIVRDLDDVAAAEIQLTENGQRVDQNPLDEGYDYQDMQNLLGYSVEEIAARVHKSVGYVLNRIKLCSLHPDVAGAMDTRELPLTHALEIAKYPAAAQSELLEIARSGDAWKTQRVFITAIETRYLLQLRHAPFDRESTALTKEGIACTNCPKRTMAQRDLFESAEARTDSCMDRQCWNNKVAAHIKIARAELAENPEKKAAIEKVPLISDSYGHYYGGEPEKGKVYRKDYEVVKEDKPCGSAEKGVFVDGDQVGQIGMICRDPKCKTHHATSISSTSISSTSTSATDDSEARLIRKEEIFNSQVAANVRLRVLKRAADLFADLNENGVYQYEREFHADLVRLIWDKLNSGGSGPATEEVRELSGLELKHDWARKPDGYGIGELTDRDLIRMQFLMVWSGKCSMYANHWNSQDEIIALAKRFEIDYDKLDAEERLALAPPKNKDVFRHYLHEVEAGNNPRKPWLYSSKWSPDKKN